MPFAYRTCGFLRIFRLHVGRSLASSAACESGPDYKPKETFLKRQEDRAFRGGRDRFVLDAQVIAFDRADPACTGLSIGRSRDAFPPGGGQGSGVGGRHRRRCEDRASCRPTWRWSSRTGRSPTSCRRRRWLFVARPRRSMRAASLWCPAIWTCMRIHSISTIRPPQLKLMLANGVTGYRQMSGSPELLKARTVGKLNYPDAPELLALPGTILTDTLTPTPAAAVGRGAQAAGAGCGLHQDGGPVERQFLRRHEGGQVGRPALCRPPAVQRRRPGGGTRHALDRTPGAGRQ